MNELTTLQNRRTELLRFFVSEEDLKKKEALEQELNTIEDKINSMLEESLSNLDSHRTKINEQYYMQNLPVQRVPNPVNVDDYWHTDEWLIVNLHIAAGLDPYNFVDLKDGKFMLKDKKIKGE